MAEKYGYARVSTQHQNPARQEEDLKNFGITAENIFTDKVSGRDFQRENYQKLRKKLRKGDLLVVKSLDRLGRNYADIQKEWQFLSKKSGVFLVVLDMPILDTRKEKDLMGQVISDIVLQLLSYVAETERNFIRERQAEGIALAKARGQHLGRPRRPYPEGFSEIYKQTKQGKLTQKEASQRLEISISAVRWLFKRWEKEGGT